MTPLDRRSFIEKSGLAAGAVLVNNPYSLKSKTPAEKMRVAMVGTGIRGTNMWGKDVVADYADHVEFVGLCDINPGRLEFGKKYKVLVLVYEKKMENPAVRDIHEL